MAMKFDEGVLIVLATAPAGLGHIRVTEALRQGLSSHTRVVDIGISDPGLQWIHRVSSLNKSLKRVMEFSQENPVAERVFAKYYQRWLRMNPSTISEKLTEIVRSAEVHPKTVVVLATHFGLAHQLAACKAALSRDLGVRIVLAVVVTDDSPQKMWAVTGADVIFVPSNTTRETLLAQMPKIPGSYPEMVTIPYPLSLEMGEVLSVEEYQDRTTQVKRNGAMSIMIPISGAAVQLDYFKALISVVTGDGEKVIVVSRDSSYTRSFLNWCRKMVGVELVAHVQDGDVVRAYEREYMMSVIAVEVTKPSEQAFKVLYAPRQRGGSLLLFSAPVGRQEKDNMAFMRRHRLIPSVDDQARIDELVHHGNQLHITGALLERASHWRGLMLPESGSMAGIAIKRLKKVGVLARMAEFGGFVEKHDEISSEGVKKIWDEIGRLI